MRGKKHNDDVRAQVMAALLAGQSVTEAAAEYRLSHQTVSEWKSYVDAEKFGELRRKKGEELDNLLFGYLSKVLAALATQAEVFSDKDYLKKQPADQAAVLHGVMADKAVRILEASDRAEELSPAEYYREDAVNVP